MRHRSSIGCALTLLCLALPVAAAGRTADRPTEASNHAAATRDAEERLAAMQLPPGAMPSAGPPAGVGAALAGPSIRPAGSNLIDLTAWWAAPGGPSEVLDWFRASLPAGTRV